jgi:SAM-dependent methyltransferase
MTTEQGLTYDTAIAANYAKHRGVWPEILQPLLENSGVGRDSQVLEVGCGTGNYIIAVQFITGCQARGVDISEEMLAHAKRRDSPVTFAVGSAEYLDVADASLDLVFSVDVTHHLGSPADHYREAHRVLAPGGRVLTVTRSEGMLDTGSVTARYFPETVAANKARFPSSDALRRQLADAGFNAIEDVVVSHLVEVSNAALYASKARSTLHLIPEDCFQRGLAALRRDLELGPVTGEQQHLIMWAVK